ncbi:FCD domain-containing protein [Aurantimonas marina]|uniref:FCD domain-containing protein n=1 Tax=Aurantimonas marina TaxID=2780508 RepID=UPI0019D15593|nr:FCD domain-containing protein [Aurantimonas marina]
MSTIEGPGESSELVTLKTSSLTSVVEKEIERLILGGKLQPGERLNEFQLANRFGMSRGPLREAMRSLNARGLVDVVRNRGVFVRQIPVEEALEIYDLRSAIFGLAGRLLADRLTDEMLLKLKAFLKTMDGHAANGDFDAYYPVNLAFHAFLVTSTGNKTLVSEYQSFVDRLHLCRTRTLVQAKGLSVSNYEHREMVDALASGNINRAHEAFFRHVQRAKLRFLSTIEEPANENGALAVVATDQ